MSPSSLQSSASATTAIAQLLRLVRDREILEADFRLARARLPEGDNPSVEAWAEATLALSHVNAGTACILSFWRLGAAATEDRITGFLAGAHASADICRFAGAKAALTCLEALPAALRLAGSAASLAAWWRGLSRLAREAPALVDAVAPRVELFLANSDGLGFEDFVAAGLKATANDQKRRVAFFALQDPLAQALRSRCGGAAGFVEIRPMLDAFVSALWSGEPRLREGPAPGTAAYSNRAMIASDMVLLPPILAGVPPYRARPLYRATTAHAYAHLTMPEVRHKVGQLKPLQIALIGLVEDARVEAIAIQRHPGLRRLWAEFHTAQPGGAMTAVNLMARLARGLLDPGYKDADGFVEKGRAMFATADLQESATSRVIGGLLGNDLGQMRLQFNAKTYVIEPAYRCDNMHLWELPETPEDALSIAADVARRSNDKSNGETEPGDDEPGTHGRPAGHDDRATPIATYPEWDVAAGVERPDWTVLRDVVPRLDNRPVGWAGEADLRAKIARIVRRSLVGHSMRRTLREEGEMIDLDAVVEATVARRSGAQPNNRLYRDRRPIGRDIATLVIVDVSQSTSAIGASGRSVLEAERVAVAALAAALEARGDKFALRAFASCGREDVRVTRLKDFDEPMSDLVTARLGGLKSGLSTRLGAALRHAGAELSGKRTSRKLVLVLTDGEPSDIDVANPCELVEDSRRAVTGLRRGGIDVFGVVMDPEDAGSGPAIFGRYNTLAVRRLEELPAKLAGVYFRLAQR